MRNKSLLEKPVGGSAADIADAIAKKHTRQHSITATADHTSTATSGKLLKADANGLPVDATNTDAEAASAVSLKHTQGTDQGLDTGGANAVTAAQAKAGYTHSGTAHAPSDAVSLATVKADSDVASAISLKHAAVTVSAPIVLTGQAIELKNNAGSPAQVTAIDVGVLASSDTVIPTSLAVVTAIAAAGSFTHPQIMARSLLR